MIENQSVEAMSDLEGVSVEAMSNLEGATEGNCADELEESSRINAPLWRGNWNIYWVLSMVMALWFLFIHTPMKYRVEKILPDVILHLASAYAVYLTCIWNSFHTPSSGPNYRWVLEIFTSLTSETLQMPS